MKLFYAVLLTLGLMTSACQQSVTEKDVFGNIQVNGTYWMDIDMVYTEQDAEPQADTWSQVLPIVQVGDEITFIGFPAESTTDSFELVGTQRVPSSLFSYTIQSSCTAGGGGDLESIATKFECAVEFWNEDAEEFQDPYDYSYDYKMSNIQLFTNPFQNQSNASSSAISGDPDRMVMPIPRRSFLKAAMERRGLDTKYPNIYTRL